MAYGGWHFGLNAQTLLFYYSRRTLLFLLIIPLAGAEHMSFNYHNFSNADLMQLNLEGNASISDVGIQLTSNIVDPNSNKRNGSFGRVISTQPFHLWNKSSNELKDFNTNFSFVIYSNKSSCGDGLAFFLASPNLTNTTNDTTGLTAGGIGIGRVDNLTDLQTEYQFVAVEFDTFPNQWDPPGKHVGVNVNSMSSDLLEEWVTDTSERNERGYSCRIQYNSTDNYLKVFFTGYKVPKGVVKQYLVHQINLRHHLPDYVIVGISASTAVYSEEHTLLSWSFSTSLPNNVHAIPRKKSKLLEGMGIGAGLSVSVAGLVYALIWKMNKRNEEDLNSETTSDLNMDDEFQMNTGPKKISYDQLISATNNFEEKQNLGQGAFGWVYKGYLKDSDSYVAIKRISADSTQGVKEYAAEVKIISQLRHKNLVKLTGWCHKKNDLLLIYEYMPNGSLDYCLFGGENSLSWQVRYNIALGLASALFYLQEEWEKCVLHGGITSSNIMLDSNFNAKLGDFGLAMLVDHEKGSQTTVMDGTMDHLAPEYMNTGNARKETDIFSFGMVLLEVSSGRKAIHNQDKEGQIQLFEWVWELYGLRNLLEAADPKLCGVFDVQQMECLLVVGLWCANPDCTSRPSIRQVIKVLNFEAPLPNLQQQIPVLLTNLCSTTDELFFTVPSSLQATDTC